MAIDEELLEERSTIVVNNVTDHLKATAQKIPIGQTRMYSVTPGSAKDIDEFTELVRQAIDHFENTQGVNDESKISYSRDYSLKSNEREVITHEIKRREPGIFDQSAPFEGGVKNYRPLLREEIDDVDNPGYKVLIFGYWYDNLIRFTIYARTHKEADDRAMWFEKLMTSYLWFFRYSGVQRVLYYGRGEEIVKEYDGFKMFGRTIDFFVRTEEITTISEKTIEQIALDLKLST